MAQARVDTNGLQVAEVLYRFVEDEALPGSGIDSDQFWSGAAALFATFRPPTEKALADRLATQHRIDAYHGSSSGPVDLSAYLDFLRSIGYLADVPADFAISTDGVDPEIAQLSGPQLVVPLLNARFAINAANARWGSLYDALYGTDVLPETDGRERGSGYNPRRGEDVIAYGRALLDEHLALAGASHADVDGYFVDDTGLGAISDGEVARLVDPSQFVGYSGSRAHPTSLLLAHHGLHVEIVVDRSDPVGATDRAGVKDLVLESALTVIMDLEDSVAAVDAADKVLGYRNWLQLMQGTLTAEVSKGDRTFTRRLMPDRTYQTLSGPTTRPGRSVMFVRQVGHLMSTDAVLDPDGPVPEGILDALMTALGSLADLREGSALRNSRTGSMYVVKPKMHGPDEVALACDILAAVEEVLNLPARTIKIGIMDEERRTSANLRASIHAARDRVAFINTGFLDRTGDEIHTSMVAGPMVRKEDMRSQPWIRAYEDGNVDAGLACGFSGRAQIGKGMWAAPESMADMVAQKGAHPRAGADCAWVPSPTAATLHAIHYHQIDVKARQEAIAGRPAAHLSDLLTPPVGDARAWSESDRAAELDNNVQGILGYVVRWVDAGIGCSKVPDISGVPLMEDRATCRISSQHIANWLRHGVVSPEQVVETLHRIAALVDQQNARVEGYRPMAPDFDGQAFLAAHDLIFEGAEQPNGYTEPILHRRRAAVKADRSTSPSQPQGSSSA